MSLLNRPFRRTGRSGDTSKHADAREYTKRPTLALCALKEGSGGYSRNANRLNDEKKYLVKRRRMRYAVPVCAFFGVAALTLWGPFMNNRPEILSAQQTNVVSRTMQPDVVPLLGASDEKPVANYIDAYKTASARPRVLTIESLGVRARVLEVGIDGRGQPQLPKNSYDAGWYNVSVLPGEAGAVVLSGACSGSVGSGVFYRLNELEKGAQVVIEKGDGTQVSYVVEGSETVAAEAVDMRKALVPSYGASRGLSLIGCTGAYDSHTNDFAHRIVVYALQE